MIDVEKTIISQYGNSPTLLQLIQNINQYIDPWADIDNFYNLVWNVDTAVGFGLDIWGRIVNVSRLLKIPTDNQYFGFNEASPTVYPYGQGTFYDPTATATQTYSLSDDAYRQLIYAKALANIISATPLAINQLLQNMFSSRGRCYVNDLGSMSMRYTFEFVLTPLEFSIVTQSGVFPRPAGVSTTMISSEFPVFGFQEMGAGAAPYDQAPFISENATNAIK